MDDERSEEVSGVIRKGLALLAAMAVVIALGTWLVVHSLGLNDGGDGQVLGTPAPATPLPSTALTSGSDPGATASDDPTGGTTDGPTEGSTDGSAGADAPDAKGLRLSVTPLRAAPSERVNLTGTYPGHDSASLQVQRREGGAWADFPTQANVNMGTFETFVQTSRVGPNRFRVFDPAEDRASNVVTVIIG